MRSPTGLLQADWKDVVWACISTLAVQNTTASCNVRHPISSVHTHNCPLVVFLSIAVLSHRQCASAWTSRAQGNETRTFCTSDSHPHQSCCKEYSQGL